MHITKKIIFHLQQSLLTIGIFLAVAGFMLNSYIAVNSIDGTHVYKIFPTGSEEEFEESEIYHDLFRNTVSDITQLVAIKGQLETDGEFDPLKKINITNFATQISAQNECGATANYELDDLIKWGKYGIEYNTRTMTLSEFVNYFGYCIFPENFTVDEYGELKFDGFYRLGENSLETGEIVFGSNGEVLNPVPTTYGKSIEEVSIAWAKMQESGYSKEQFEGLVLSYIINNNLSGLDMDYENESLRILVSMMSFRYPTVEGDKMLIHYANNWIDYLKLQHNLEVTINNISLNYQRYQLCNNAYREGNTNVRYMVRMITSEGPCTYTNISEMKDISDDEVTEIFSGYSKYLIYYPDSLVYMGNTILSEREFYKYVSVYDYAYPDTTHIWLGVDSSYSVKGDAFYNAAELYGRIVPSVGRFLLLIILLTICALATVVYLTIVTGTHITENGEKELRLMPFDRLKSEWLLILAALFIWGGIWGVKFLNGILEMANFVSTEETHASNTLSKLYEYGMFALFGLYVSVAFSIVWYSFVRRLKAGKLWQNSLLRGFVGLCYRMFSFVTKHRNSMISILMPYNIFLFVNIMAIFFSYEYRENEKLAILIVFGIVLFDGLIGVALFRSNAERNEIVDGINRIRNGEVEYKVDVENLHGTNRELADAVNNIGEGIDKAVRTSMKDEQMKTDLITNVSHDIKTPLTSIINYVDLLKRLKIDDEPAKSYIDILDTKAQRLKQLTDDLVEASKISSGNIILNKEKLNLNELVYQGIGEFSEKLEAARLEIVFGRSEGPAYIFADSRRMWRILENLLNNVCKYAMEGTRVYIDISVLNQIVTMHVKNISRQQMNISPDELTERFIRGDSARSTEGSGLGLSIAKSLTRVQGGEFEIYLDGDLFKVSVSFPEFDEERDITAETEADLTQN